MAFAAHSQGFENRMAQVDLKAMTAAIAAHAAVFAALAMTWNEAVLVEGGTRAALVSIDLAMREGGPGPKPQTSPTPERTRQQPEARPAVVPSPAALTEQEAHPPSQPPPPLSAHQAGGGGEGRTGQGLAAMTTQPQPAARLIPVSALISPAAAAPSRGHADAAQGAGGSGGGPTARAGNSAIGNFNGLIYQHLQRHRRGNTIGSGEALVAFTVEPDGAARAVSVARGSGSSRFDREALALVRRASPFPRPPDGASHSFTFAITGQ